MMKKLSLLLLLPVFFASCLKHDVLKQEADTNFRESDFYTSGNFASQLEIVISDTSIVSSVSSNGTLRCKPEFTFRLEETFVQQLEQSWDGNIEFSLFEAINGEKEEFFSENYRASFRSVKRGKVACGSTLYFNVQLNLLDPNTGRVVANTTKKVPIQTP